MIVTSSGYFATGSSAVYDLLREYSRLTTGIIGDRDYEHLPFYTPGGLFDLEDKLLIGNSIHRSDEALHSFFTEMNRLNDGNFKWCAGYENMTNGRFVKLYQKFLDSLIDCKVDSYWSYHLLPENKTEAKEDHDTGFWGSWFRKKGKKEEPKKQQKYRYSDGIWYSFADAERFYALGKEFIMGYFEMIQGGCEGDLLINHAMLPQNMKRIKRYDLTEFKAIVVDRDPRDVFTFLSHSKYVKQRRSQIPSDIDGFIRFWSWMRESEEIAKDSVLRIRFEDLIYDYENTVGRVETFLGLNPEEHTNPGKYFDPEVSKQNTQMFRLDFVNESHIDRISKELGKYTYDFPYTIKNNSKNGDYYFGNANSK